MINVKYADRQSGVVLLEALIAILIFSLGVLTIVAIQATSIKLTTDAKYRTNATLLANRLIGQMWTASGNLTTLKSNFESGGAGYAAWLAEVQQPDGLPGVVSGRTCTRPDSTTPVSILPRVTVNNATGVDAGRVTVWLYWRTPEMDADKCHALVVASQIVRN